MKCLLYEHGDLSGLGSSKHLSWAQWYGVCNPSTGKGSRDWQVLRANELRERPCLKNKVGEQQRKIFNVNLWPPHAYTWGSSPTYTHIPHTQKINFLNDMYVNFKD